jgi:ubiquitin C-terminal hydrolase
MSVEKKISPYGLPNKGNTCYINAALQTIIQIFSEFFISGEYYKKLSSDETVIDFMSDFAHLVSAVQNVDDRWSKSHVNLYLENVIQYLSKIDEFKRFIKFRQADSYEFLAQLISLLSEYLSYKISIEIDVKVDEKELDNKDRTRLVYYTFLKKTLKKTSIVDEKLRGYFRASITCAYDDCDYHSERFEPFFMLSLPIKGINTLEECLANYVKPTTLDEKNKWFCEKCKRRSQAEKKMSIWSTAEYLIISYKRYVNILITSVKDGHSIAAPFHELDLSPYVEDNKHDENIYDLCAVTVHSGNMNNGHYVIARKVEDAWTVFNDSTVIPVTESDVNNGAAYYLVYRRR